MKTYIYILMALVFSTVSCRSVQKMVDQGDYDQAIRVAAKRMQGDKVKKTKHIKILEKALHSINSNDKADIEHLSAIDDLESWERVYDIAYDIDRRQGYIIPLLPLISKDGYRGHFPLINADKHLLQARDRIKELSYKRGLQLISQYRDQNDKTFARQAYDFLGRTASLDGDYKNVQSLLHQSKEWGKEHVLVEAQFAPRFFLPSELSRYISSLRLISHDKDWIQFYDDPLLRSEFDFVARLVIEDVYISPEYEKERIYTESKEIEEGERYVLDVNGNVAKDSLGNDITEPNWILVEARVKEIHREKRLEIRGQMEIIRTSTGMGSVQPLFADAFFDDYSCHVRGDKRALTQETKKRVKAHPLFFPTDIDLLYDTTEKVKIVFENYVLDVLSELVIV